MKPPQKKRRKRVIPSKTGGGQINKSVYLYHDEAEILQQVADAEGISISAYMVRAALEKAAQTLSKK